MKRSRLAEGPQALLDGEGVGVVLSRALLEDVEGQGELLLREGGVAELVEEEEPQLVQEEAALSAPLEISPGVEGDRPLVGGARRFVLPQVLEGFCQVAVDGGERGRDGGG